MIRLKRGLAEYHFAGYIDGLGDAVEQGLVKAVGVSNYSGLFSFSAAPFYLGCLVQIFYVNLIINNLFFFFCLCLWGDSNFFFLKRHITS